ncbi:MAG: sigma 54-interacting transcriptional regulator [Polyangiales bacterium]
MNNLLGATVKLKDAHYTIESFRIEVIAGPNAGTWAEAIEGRATVGTADDVTLRLTDPTVSRYHIEFEATPEGVVMRDLGSTNGIFFGHVALREARTAASTDLRIGQSVLRLIIDGSRTQVSLSTQRSFGALLGASAAMRRVYATLERAAPTTVPVLVLGESGTGKELAARAVHAASSRAGRALEVVDCGGLPPTLIESELFGHERGAFTGAVGEKEGAFERADGGTIFLDELGEMPLEVQPKLLRALGEGEIRRLGGRKSRKVDVRVIAATNRDLRREVNAGRFRADLYYRLAVIQVRMPPLRERMEDLPLIVPSMIERIRRERRVPGALDADAELMELLSRHTWPGNVRELRNFLEQYVVLKEAPPFEGGEGFDASAGGEGADGDTALLSGLDALPLRAAKTELTERFERRYLARLLAETGGNVAEAARRAGVDRGTVFRTLRRTGMRDEKDS